MDYFNNVFSFLWLECAKTENCQMEGQKTVRFHQKYLHLCSEDE